MTDDQAGSDASPEAAAEEQAVHNALADGARYTYDITVLPSDQAAHDEEFCSVSSGGAGTRWMIADNMRAAAALLDIGRPAAGGRPIVGTPRLAYADVEEATKALVSETWLWLADDTVDETVGVGRERLVRRFAERLGLRIEGVQR